MFSYDKYGRYEILATTTYDNVTIEYRLYSNSRRPISLGGRYCLVCLENNNMIFAKNDYMLMHRLSKFVDKCQEEVK